MPKLTIVRPYEWYNQRKKIYVYIDEEKVGHVGINETVHFDISACKHKLLLKNNWTGGSKTIEVDLSDNADKTIEMSTLKYGWLLAFFIGFFANGTYFLLNKLFNLDAIISSDVYIILFIVAVLTITLLFHRKKYLKLVEV